MNRTAAPIGALLALVLVVGASALAAPNQQDRKPAPVSEASHAAGSSDAAETTRDGTGAAPSQQLLDRIVARLDDAGISTDADALAALAARYGVGGAVRLLAWADASGMSTDEIGAMFDSGMGWGEIARQMNDADQSLSLHPGIGWLMGNGHGSGQGPDHAAGLGRSSAPGQQKKQ